MMNTKGAPRAATETAQTSKKVIGLFEGLPVMINPTAEEYVDVTGAEAPEDAEKLEKWSKRFEYLGETKDGRERVNIHVYLKDLKTSDIRLVRFSIIKEVRQNGEDKPVRKTQWINSVGKTTWLNSDEGEEDLPSWFVKGRNARKALVGEEELYNFLEKWITLDKFDLETDFLMDTKPFFKGNFRELKEVVGSNITKVVGPKGVVIENPVIALATIETSADGTEYQRINSKHFFPGYSITKNGVLIHNFPKHFENKKYTSKNGAEINERLVEEKTQREEAKANGEKFKSKIYDLDRFIAGIYDSEYPVKEFFGSALVPAKDYDPEENLVASDSTIEIADDDSDY